MGKTITFTNDFTKGLSTEQIKELEEASKKTIVFDEDCPEINPELLEKLKFWTEERKQKQRKENVTIRLSPNVINTAKKIGKGYTSIMADIIETVFSDEIELEKYLKKTCKKN